MNKKSIPQIFVVEASAGSGKTYFLAKQFLKLLFNFNENSIPSLKNILAITFTNKAAIEMKTRVLELLNKLIFDNFNSKTEKEDLLNYLEIDFATAQKKSYFLLDYIIQHYSFFNIKTIDSFINSLLYSAAFNLNLSSAFKIEETYHDYLNYALDKVIEQGINNSQIRNLFKRFLTQYLYLNKNINWFPKKDIYDIIKELFYLNNIFFGKFVKSKYSQKDIIKLKKILLKQLNELYKILPENTNKIFKNSLSSFLEKNGTQINFSSPSDFFLKEDFPITKKSSVPENVLLLWKNIRKNLILLTEMESSYFFNSYIEIFEKLLPEFYFLKEKKDILFLEELNKYAKKIFSTEQITIPELYYRLATQIKHYLIDEFQDTSILQWQNLFPMISEAISTGGTLFYVGDKKQAIYRFRGGEVDLFDGIKESFLNYFPHTEILNKNYRSCEVIVNFNNLLFSQKNIARTITEIYQKFSKEKKILFSQQDVQDVLNFYSNSYQQVAHKNSKGYLKIEIIEEDEINTDEKIKNKLFETIDDLRKRNCSLQNIAILVSSNDEVETVTQWLLEKHIPVISDKTMDVRSNSIIKQIIALLKFLNSPSDNLSFTTFILGEVFLTETKIKFDAMQDFIFHTSEKFLRNKTQFFLYQKFEEQFKDVWEKYFKEFFDIIKFSSTYNIIINIINKFNILQNFSSQQGFLMHLLEIVQSNQDKCYTLSSFIEYLSLKKEKTFYITTPSASAINILTIHKSKGLEFDVVILPFFELKIEPGFGDKKFFLNFSNDEICLFNLDNDQLSYSQYLTQIFIKEYKKSLVDRLNHLYVGCTRAKNELYIFVPPKASNERNKALIFLSDIIKNSGYFEQGEKIIFEKQESSSNLMVLPINNLFLNTKFLEEEDFLPEKIFNKEKIFKGNVLHHIFSLINNLYNQEVEQIIKNIFEKMKFLYPQISHWEEFYFTTKNILSNNNLKKYFYIKEGFVEQEKVVTTKSGDIKRIDRIIYTKDEIIIIDFKNSRDNFELYKKQILEYIEIIKDIFPEKNIYGIIIYFETADYDKI